MNQLHENLNRKYRSDRRRTGFSIIEVLTSIVVAMIGVFGVMVLIPFAVKQAQTGLDSDAAVQVGRNAYAQFEISGYRNPSNWMFFSRDRGYVVKYSPFEDRDEDGDGIADKDANGEVLGPHDPFVFSIDPLGITENGNNYNSFPINSDGDLPFDPDDPNGQRSLEVLSANLRIPNPDDPRKPLPMDIASARRMCRSTDDLVFGDSLDDLIGPEQLYDYDAAVPGPLRRQSNGRISWSAIVEPYKTETGSLTSTSPSQRWSYKLHILVYKNRKTSLNDADGNMRILKFSDNRGLQSPLGNVYLTGITNVDEVHRDDWMMLINEKPGAELGFNRQIAFCRVVNSSNATANLPASLTLDGPDFTFAGATYIVHLKDVIGVYERTFVPELESTWN